MRRALLYLLICSSTLLHAQLIDTLYKDWGGIAGFFETDTGFLVVTEDAHLHFLDKDGKLFRTNYIEPIGSNLNSVYNVFKPYGELVDSFFYVATYDNHCDYLENFRLHKVDWNGNNFSYEELDQAWFLDPGRFVFPAYVGLPLRMETVGNYAFLYYPNDSILSLKYSSSAYAKDISDNGNFVVATKDSLFYYGWNIEELNLIASVKLSEKISGNVRLYFVSGNKILLQTRNELFLFSDELILEQSVSFENDEIIFYLNVGVDRIEVSSTIRDQKSFFRIYDFSLDQQAQYLLPYKSIFPAVSIFSDSILTVAGIEFYKEDKPSVAIKQTDMRDPDNGDHTNIALTNVHFVNSETSEGECFLEPVRNHYLYGITVELTNTGERTIDKVVITSEKTYCRGFCWYEDLLFYHELNDINLFPGQSKEFFISGAHIQSYQTADQFRCLMAVFPEMRVDVDHSNNSFCFDVTTSIKDPNPSHMDVYPNPVQDILYLNSEKEIKEVAVYNVNGCKVMQQEITEAGLFVEPLASGIYLIRAKHLDGQIFTDRFVKQ